MGQVMSSHHSDQKSQRSQVSGVALCMSKVKVRESVSQSVSQSVTRSPIELFWTAQITLTPFIIMPEDNIEFKSLASARRKEVVVEKVEIF